MEMECFIKANCDKIVADRKKDHMPIQKPMKHLRWSCLQKIFTVFSYLLFLKKAGSHILPNLTF